MILPGIVLTGITFPGVVVHEFAHALMCRVTQTKIKKVCYFRLGNPSGYVVSEKPSNIWKSLIISFIPFIFNSASGFIFGAASAAAYKAEGHFGVISMVLFYLGISLAFHAFPSLQDAKAIDDDLGKKETSILAKIVCAPIVFIFALKAVLNFTIIDMIWGLCVGGILPFVWLGIK
jgi:hypothetical protein